MSVVFCHINDPKWLKVQQGASAASRGELVLGGGAGQILAMSANVLNYLAQVMRIAEEQPFSPNGDKVLGIKLVPL